MKPNPEPQSPESRVITLNTVDVCGWDARHTKLHQHASTPTVPTATCVSRSANASQQQSWFQDQLCWTCRSKHKKVEEARSHRWSSAKVSCELVKCLRGFEAEAFRCSWLFNCSPWNQSCSNSQRESASLAASPTRFFWSCARCSCKQLRLCKCRNNFRGKKHKWKCLVLLWPSASFLHRFLRCSRHHSCPKSEEKETQQRKSAETKVMLLSLQKSLWGISVWTNKNSF